MIERLIGHQFDYGRSFNRTIVANLITRIGGRYAYAVPDDELEHEDYQSAPYEDCLVDFTPQKWNRVLVKFEQARDSLIRIDATFIVLPSELVDAKGSDEYDEDDKPQLNDEINEKLVESHDEFTKGYDKMRDWIKFHACLSHLQPQFEMAIQKGSVDGAEESVVIPHENIIEFE